MKLLVLFYLLIFPFFVSVNGNENDGFGNIKGIVSTIDGQPAAYVTVLIKNTGKVCHLLLGISTWVKEAERQLTIQAKLNFCLLIIY